jgi:hypothetical protein
VSARSGKSSATDSLFHMFTNVLRRYNTDNT